MNKNKLTPNTFKPIPQVEFPSIGLGIMRTSGSIILLLLQLENGPSRVNILVDVAKKLGITLEDITETYTDKVCPHCAMSLKAHKGNGGECF